MKLLLIIFTTIFVLSMAPITIIIFKLIVKLMFILGNGGYHKISFHTVFDIFFSFIYSSIYLTIHTFHDKKSKTKGINSWNILTHI